MEEGTSVQRIVMQDDIRSYRPRRPGSAPEALWRSFHQAGDMHSPSQAARLILLRHGKSDRDHPRLSDHDRPLNTIGEQEARGVGEWMQENRVVPDVALCSTATRAQQTLRVYIDFCREKSVTVPAVIHAEELYLAEHARILDCIERYGKTTRCVGEASTLILVGHNPGLSHLASVIARDRIVMPTASLAVFRFPGVDWSAVTSAPMPELEFLAKPRAEPR